MKKILFVATVLLLSSAPAFAIKATPNEILGSAAPRSTASDSYAQSESRMLRAADSAFQFAEHYLSTPSSGFQFFQTRYANDQRANWSLSAGLSDLSKKAQASINLKITW